MNSEKTVFTRKTPDCHWHSPSFTWSNCSILYIPQNGSWTLGPRCFFYFFYILVLVFHVQFCCWICDMSVSWATYKSPQTTSSSLHRLFLHRSDLSYTLFQFLKEIPVGYSSKLFPPPFWADLLLGFLAPKICATPRSISDTWLRSTWAWPLPRPRCSNRMMGRWVMRESGVSPWRVQVRTIIFIRKRLKKIVL